MKALQRLNQMRVGALQVSEATFAPSMVMDWHTHDTPVFAVFLDGSMDVDFRGRRALPCGRAAVQVHPAGESHRQTYGRTGARILVVEPGGNDPSMELEGFLSSIHNFVDERILGLAWRAQLELESRDEVTPLALTALAYEMIAIGARRGAGSERRHAPPWLGRAEQVLHAGYLGNLRLSDVAAEVGVHPTHLARVFRQHRRVSLGAYVRRLRLEWAARRLAESNDRVSEVALAAGFADQSHLTRLFKRYVGVTPARYRHLKRS